jgi:hypothetical protein
LRNETDVEAGYECKVNPQAAILFIVLGTIIPICICIGMVSYCLYIRSAHLGRAKVGFLEQSSSPNAILRHFGGVPVAHAEAIPAGAVYTNSNVPVAHATVAPTVTVMYPMQGQQGQMMQQAPPSYEYSQQYPQTQASVGYTT